MKRLPFFIRYIFDLSVFCCPFAGTALICGTVQLLACGVRVFFFKSPTRLDRAKKIKKNKKKLISEMISKHTCRPRRVNNGGLRETVLQTIRSRV